MLNILIIEPQLVESWTRRLGPAGYGCSALERNDDIYCTWRADRDPCPADNLPYCVICLFLFCGFSLGTYVSSEHIERLPRLLSMSGSSSVSSCNTLQAFASLWYYRSTVYIMLVHPVHPDGTHGFLAPVKFDKSDKSTAKHGIGSCPTNNNGGSANAFSCLTVRDYTTFVHIHVDHPRWMDHIHMAHIRQ